MLSIAFLELIANFEFDLTRMKENIRYGIWTPTDLDGGKIATKQLDEYSSALDLINSLGLNINDLSFSDFIVLKAKSIKLLYLKTISCVIKNWEQVIVNTVSSPDLWSKDVSSDVIQIMHPTFKAFCCYAHSF